MSSDARETGWQRFLDRLKQLWGNSRRGALTPLSTAMAADPGTSAVASARAPTTEPAVTHDHR
jgi:hypothetical protein